MAETSRKKVVVVDDSSFNLNVCKNTLKDLYELYLVRTAENMFSILEKVIPDLILLDVEMPGIHGYEAIKMLKSNEAYKDIPVIFLSAMDDEVSELEGFDLGAVDYIHKPFVKALLIRRIDTQITLSENRKELLAMKKLVETQLSPTAEKKNELLDSINIVLKTIDASIVSEDLNEIKNSLKHIKPEVLSIQQFIEDHF